MALEESARRTEAALTELAKASARADGWSDGQRRQFERMRMQPMQKAGGQLNTALVKAGERIATAEKLLR